MLTGERLKVAATMEPVSIIPLLLLVLLDLKTWGDVSLICLPLISMSVDQNVDSEGDTKECYLPLEAQADDGCFVEDRQGSEIAPIQ